MSDFCNPKVEALILVILDGDHFEQNWPKLFFYKTRSLHYRFQQIRDVFFILFDVLNIFFYNKKVSFS